MPKLLIIDDEPGVLFSLESALQSPTLKVVGVETANDGLEAARRESPDVVLLDVQLPDCNGLEVFNQLHAADPRLPVILMTAHGTTDTAIEAMKRGAFDYLIKPVELSELKDVLDRAFELSRLSRTPAVINETPLPGLRGDQFIGRSRAMHDVYKQIGRVAAQDVNVLILGESGTGKELVARALFQHSQRKDKPFLAINCAAIPETLLESELFGHEKGSFTGADKRRVGKFEQADGGTLFMDEIGDMSLPTQSKVLRILQEQRFERVGGNEVVATNVRLIAATHQDLPRLVEQGRFRNDLFYRLNVFTIQLPPLRDRIEDLPMLVDYFVSKFNGELNKRIGLVAPDAMSRLLQHPWPGNIRELQNAIKYAIVQAAGDVLTSDCLPLSILAGEHPIISPPKVTGGTDQVLDLVELTRYLISTQQPDIYETVINAVDRIVLREAMAQTNGNQVATSELLGIARNTLRAKLKSLNLLVEKQLSDESSSS